MPFGTMVRQAEEVRFAKDSLVEGESAIARDIFKQYQSIETKLVVLTHPMTYP
jgi:hypothetical protein